MEREEAIKWLKGIQGCYKKKFFDLDLLNGLCVKAIDMAIEALSAEAVQGWIPCSERLPDSDRPVLVTIQWTDSDREVIVGEYWGNPTKAAPESEKGWGTYGDHVTAWREMPEPYREVRRKARTSAV